MKKQIILSLFCTIFISCGGQFKTLSRYKKNFTYCNEGRYTGLDTLININGVYYIAIIRDMYNNPFPVHRTDTFYMNIMFWNDGTTVYNFLGEPNTYQLKFDEILSKIARGKKESFFNNNSWGTYRIVGDTIKAQYMHVPGRFSLNDSWYGYERCFKIANKNTLVYLPMMTKSLDCYIDKYTKEKMIQGLKESKDTFAVFFPVERMLPSNCKLKKKKWFWCDKEDWQAYMDKIKQKKTKKK